MYHVCLYNHINEAFKSRISVIKTFNSILFSPIRLQFTLSSQEVLRYVKSTQETLTYGPLLSKFRLEISKGTLVYWYIYAIFGWYIYAIFGTLRVSVVG